MAANPQTLAQKIIARASGRQSVAPGEIVTCNVDLAMIHDSGGPRRVKPLLERLGVSVWDASKVVLVSDHYTPAVDEASAAIQKLTREFARDQGIALSVWGCFVPLGIALGGAAASAMEPGFGWRGGMAVAAIPPAAMLILVVAVFARMEPLGSDRTDALPDAFIPIAGAGRAGLALAAGFGFFAANFLALMAFLPTRWQALEPMDAGPASIAFAAVSITSIGGSLFVAARLARGGDARRLAMLGLVLQGGFGIAALLLPDRDLSILAAGLAIGLGGFTPAAAFALGPRITASGAALARLNGWISGLGSAGSFLGAPAMGHPR